MKADNIINQIKDMENYIKYLQTWRENMQEEIDILRGRCIRNGISIKMAAKKKMTGGK